MVPAPVSEVAGDRGVGRLVPLFIGIVVVEILTIAALYWFGRHFGPA
jgi:hypothetical protein